MSFRFQLGISEYSNPSYSWCLSINQTSLYKKSEKMLMIELELGDDSEKKSIPRRVDVCGVVVHTQVKNKHF